jgi:hypothetical protein
MPSLIRGPEDIVALCDIGLLFGGLALFYLMLLAVRNSESGVLIVLFSEVGFLARGLVRRPYGRCRSDPI